jgi:uncharacterized protein YggE
MPELASSRRPRRLYRTLCPVLTLRGLALGLVLGVGAAGPLPAHAQGHGMGPEGNPPGTIRVVGEATVTAKPDMAELDVGVVSEAKTAEAASADNQKKMERVIAALKKEVGNGGEVKTVGYLVTQRYGEVKNPEHRPVIVAYVVTNVVRARIPDVKAAGRIVDLALKSGANEVQRLIFTLKNPEPVQAEALRAAASKARSRATALAAALGLKLGNVLSVSDGEFSQRPVPYAEMSRSTKLDSGTPIEAGDLEVPATVTVYFMTTR